MERIDLGPFERLEQRIAELLPLIEKVEHIGIVKVQPGDTIIFHLNVSTTWAKREGMIELAEKLFPDNKIVLTEGVESVTVMEEVGPLASPLPMMYEVIHEWLAENNPAALELCPYKVKGAK